VNQSVTKKPLLGPKPAWCPECDAMLRCPTCRADYEERNRVHMSEKTTPVPDELLRRLAEHVRNAGAYTKGYDTLVAMCKQLPSPPPLDPVEECVRAFKAAAYADSQAIATCEQAGVRAALQRYRELGCPELK